MAHLEFIEVVNNCKIGDHILTEKEENKKDTFDDTILTFHQFVNGKATTADI
jgi:hypothetical protein